MTNQTELNQLEKDIKAYKTQIELGDALDKLRANRDFNKVVINGLMKDEALRLVHLLADPAMDDDKSREAIHREMMAIATLGQHFNGIATKAEMARRSLNQAEELYTDLAQEG